MTVAADAPLAPLPTQLPAVARRATLPAGFEAGGARVGIKASGRPDLAVIRTTAGPASAAAVFTTNRFAAAPVRLSRRHLALTAPDGEGRFGWVAALVCTSGSANAATGAVGDADQEAIAAALATAAGVPVEETFHLSTGLIGTRLPVDRVEAGLRDMVAARLEASPEAWEAAATAFCTTDSRIKLATAELELPDADGRPVRVVVSGLAKGVGMIHPQMATMLAVVTTDAAADPATLHDLLRAATVRTWDQLTVDGDTSTNDTVVVLASGASGAAPVRPASPEAARLGQAIEAVARDLARQQAADGEGATTLVTCQVSGAADDVEARAVARAVVASSLVKAAVHGHDPNWGRIASAAGTARLPIPAVLEAAGLDPEAARVRAGSTATVDPDRIRIAIAGFLVYDGRPVAFEREAASRAMRGGEVLLRVDLGLGLGTGEAFGCDLTEEYVVENAEYTT